MLETLRIKAARLLTKGIKEDNFEEYRRLALGLRGRGGIGKYDWQGMLSKYRGWVFAAIRSISTSVASGELFLNRRLKEDIEEIKEHDFLTLWKHPNPEFPRRFIYKMNQMYKLLTGNSYWHFILNGLKQPSEIWFIPPTNIKPVRDKTSTKLVDYYEYQPGKGKSPIRIDPFEIMHIKEPNPISPLIGLSQTYAASMPIELIEYMEAYNERLFRKGAVPRLILRSEGNINPEARKRSEESWEQNYSGENSEGVALLEGGIRVEKISESPRDMDYREGYDQVLQQIIAIYGTTLAKLGITKDVNRANAYALELSYQRDTVMPELKDLADWVTQFVLLKYYRDNSLFCNFKSTIPEDELVKANMRVKYTTARIIDRNEAREEIGKEPKPWGEGIFITPMEIPYDGTVPPPQKPTEDKKEKSLDDGVFLRTKEARLQYWFKFAGRQELIYEQLQRALKKGYTRIGKKVVANIRKYYKKELEFKGVEWLIPPEEYFKEEIFGICEPFIKQSLTNGVQNIIFDFSLPIDFRMTPDLTSKYLSLRENLLEESIHDTYERIREYLQVGIQEGETTREMAKRLEKNIDKIGDFKSRLIARTEINSSENGGHIEVIKSLNWNKQWITAGDAKVRDEHVILDGEIVGANEVFSNGLEYPQDPNCRCGVAPVKP